MREAFRKEMSDIQVAKDKKQKKMDKKHKEHEEQVKYQIGEKRKREELVQRNKTRLQLEEAAKAVAVEKGGQDKLAKADNVRLTVALQKVQETSQQQQQRILDELRAAEEAAARAAAEQEAPEESEAASNYDYLYEKPEDAAAVVRTGDDLVEHRREELAQKTEALRQQLAQKQQASRDAREKQARQRALQSEREVANSSAQIEAKMTRAADLKGLHQSPYIKKLQLDNMRKSQQGFSYKHLDGMGRDLPNTGRLMRSDPNFNQRAHTQTAHSPASVDSRGQPKKYKPNLMTISKYTFNMVNPDLGIRDGDESV